MEKEILKRWENYRKANTDKPSVRENELRTIFNLIHPQEGQTILEVGTGNGYLTFPLAQAVGPSGKVITTDVNKGNIEDVIQKNKLKKFQIVTKLLPVDAAFLDKEYKNYFDIVTTIATLHHFDNRKNKTGDSGRRNAIKHFYENLKPGGSLVIADVLHGTISQKYFDAIDTPEHCYPHGHPHDFFGENELKEVIESVGFKKIYIECLSVPWKFSSREEMKEFIHTIHNAKCSSEESLKLAEEILGSTKANDHIELGWQLFFLKAVK